jgi:hypothetical protein
MNVNFDEWKKINDAVTNASDEYQIKSFKPWESDNGKEYITIQLMKVK